MELIGTLSLGIIGFLWSWVVPFLVVLTVLVFVHEMGHYLIARRNGVRVETFSIGFGPEIAGWTDRVGTRWKVSAIPLGGYVKMFGDQDAVSTPSGSLREMSEEEKAVAFHFKPVGQRAAIVFAGPAVNYVFAVLVLAVLFATVGQSYSPPVVGSLQTDGAAETAGVRPGDRVVSIDGTEVETFQDIQQAVLLHPGEAVPVVIERDGERMTVRMTVGRFEQEDRHGNVQVVGTFGAVPQIPPVVGQVIPDSAAAEAGLQADDRIVSIDGNPIHTFGAIREYVEPSAGRPLTVVVERDGQRLTYRVTPRTHERETATGRTETVGLLGVGSPPPPRRRFDPATALWEGAVETVEMTRLIGVSVGQIIAGSRSVRELGGPLRIAEMSGETAERGLGSYLWFMALLSLNLCLINLLPIPMLDGGHLLFYAIETLRGKPLGARAQELGFRIGMALVLTLMLLVLWNDLVHLRLFG